MANMAYCRFTNTLSDLRDCWNNMDAEDLSDAEKKARIQLIRLCSTITSDYEDEIEGTSGRAA